MLPPLDKIQIQTISTCNANCIFCPYAESWHKENPGRMKKKIFNKLLKELEEFEEFNTLCPYLMNEPLTDSTRIFSWISDFYDKYPDKTVEMSINPEYLTKKNRTAMLKTFKDKKHTIPISFHGMNELSLEYIMGINYKTSLDNTIKFLQLGQNDLNISLRGAGMSMNGRTYYFDGLHYVSYWMDIMKANDIDPNKINVQPFLFHDRAGQIQREERDANKNNFGKVRDIGPENPFDCLRFDKVFHVQWNGDIVSCCMDYKKEIPFLGNVEDMTMLEYYQSDGYLKWYAMGTGKIKTEENFICKRCASPGG